MRAILKRVPEKMSVSVWIEVYLLPKGTDTSGIKVLADVKR
jgi:hypothetical protein